MAFLFRCFSGKKTQPSDDHDKRVSVKKSEQPRNISGGSTWPDDSEFDDDFTLNSGTTQDDPQYRGLYKSSSSTTPSLAEATSGDTSFRSYSDSSSLSTSNDPLLETSNKLGRNLLLLSDNNNVDSEAEEEDRLLFLEKKLYSPQPRREEETTIQVTLPPGKVGMVLNTPEDGWGAPVVYQIKKTCPVKDQVQVGDKLISVDGQDCTAKTAVEASRLLGSKAQQAERNLVFARIQ